MMTMVMIAMMMAAMLSTATMMIVNNDDCVGDCDNAVNCDDDEGGSGMHCIPPMGCICKMPPRREIYIYK